MTEMRASLTDYTCKNLHLQKKCHTSPVTRSNCRPHPQFASKLVVALSPINHTSGLTSPQQMDSLKRPHKCKTSTMHNTVSDAICLSIMTIK